MIRLDQGFIGVFAFAPFTERTTDDVGVVALGDQVPAMGFHLLPSVLVMVSLLAQSQECVFKQEVGHIRPVALV